MENQWSKQEWVQATRNFIESQIRDGFISEKAISSPQQSTPSVTTPTKSPVVSEPVAGKRSLDEIQQELGNCTRCALSQGRKNIVFGVGNPKADLMIIGEAPGADEDAQGEPFVGKAGQLLTDIIKAIGLSRNDVYICNVIKCRPPGNRPPEQGEIEKCSPFLMAQIASVQPKLICTLGKFATQTVLQTERPISSIRGNFQDFNGIPLMPTFHPSYLLRNPAAKKDVWEDMKKLHAEFVKLTGKNIVRKGN